MPSTRLRAMGLRAALSLCLAFWVVGTVAAQPRKRLVFQGFWWDFRNENYPQGWANYIVDLAPRLRAAGVEAVWVPVNVKNANPFSVGYSPFDHYDLGDKFQKGQLKTPFGDKDEYLRMVAVLKANGIEVVQDVVLNHMDGAGSANGAGAVDPAGVAFYRAQSGLPNPDPTGGNKTFRYTSVATPAGDESAAEYLSRRGRWPKNWQNFHPNPADARFTGDDPTGITFGPDISFNPGAIGQATGAGYNPIQASGYMRNEARAWMIWLKKQTGMDGVRLDAVKHFPTAVQEDMLWNMMNNAGFASGGENMLNVAEWVGGAGELDAYVDAVQGRAGTFDFALHGFGSTPGLVAMVYGLGNYDMGQLPAAQQQRRARTFPFVNNHDTFRPPLASDGRYPTDPQGNPRRWSSNSELAPNIDPREPRLAAAYAVVMAVDGNPNVFMEDLFDLGTTGRRFNHLPTDTVALPVREDIRRLMQCYQRLGFQQGAYLVRHQSPDHLVIERGARAVIGITDSWDQVQTTWVTTSFAPGTRLIDYGGSSTQVLVVPADGRVQIVTPPCNGSLGRRGYSVWAPEGQSLVRPPALGQAVTQEWEMDDDLGDSHPRSLQQGGRLPADGRTFRTAGKIMPRPGQTVTLELFSADTTLSTELVLGDACGVPVARTQGRGRLEIRYLVPASAPLSWMTLRARQAAPSSAPLKVWIKATYLGPDRLDARALASAVPPIANLGPDRAFCSGATLSDVQGPGFTYRWLDSAGSVLSTATGLRITRPGTVILEKTATTSGCQARDTLFVTRVDPLPTFPTLTVAAGDTVQTAPQAGATYEWFIDGAAVPGLSGHAVRAPRSGSFSVRVTTPAGCSLLGPSLAVTLTSLTRPLEGHLALYPNPANGQVLVELGGLATGAGGPLEVALLSVTGQRLMTREVIPSGGQARLSLSLDGVAAGSYLVQVRDAQGRQLTRRLAVAR